MTWHIESAHGTWLAAGYETEREADLSLHALRLIADEVDAPQVERDLAHGARVVEDFDWSPYHLRLYRGLT
jgi:hypothetical protein